MAARVELPERATAEYMYGLLAYSTWNVYDGRQQIGQVTINGPDNSAYWTPFVDGEPVFPAYPANSFGWWLKWLRRHRHDPF